MSLFSVLIDFFVLLLVVGLVAIGVRVRKVLGVRLDFILLLIVGGLVLFASLLLKVIAALLGGVVLLAIATGLLLFRNIRP
jgi:hypothetical protein